ncbi:MAG: acyl-CoA dehydrogenase family protein [Alphaproteobacteria bacterium]|nr:acyl-CoA dehydrogenase family protein [Alphaproteobacteria bacterium]
MLLSEEQTLIRDTARAFAQEQVAPHARAWEAAGEIPRALLTDMGRLGFMGMCVPAEWGGAGAEMVSYVLALEEIAAADGGLSTVMSVNNSPDCAALLAYGSTEQKERWLKPLARGEILGAFCLTEPQAGSDASNLRTRAERRGNGWVLNGVKQFITSGRTADMALVFAVTDGAAGKRGISCFIVPTKAPGYRVASVEKKLGQKSSDTCQIAFDNCAVGADALLGTEGEGYKIALANLEVGRIGIAAQAVGMSRAAFEAALAYAGEREAFGTKIVNHQAIQFRLADMATKIAVARQMVLHAATLRDARRPCLTEAAMAKLYASEMAEEVCSAAIQIHGGYGYVSDYLVEKIWRDVRVCQIYEGTSDVQRMLIGRGLAGL